jgi:hypothetical protein
MKYLFLTSKQWITIYALSEDAARVIFAKAFPHIPESAILRVHHAEKPVTGHRGPTPYEIRIGEGATHYKDFPLEAWLRPSGSSLKKWIKCPYDGLRYTR